MRFNVLVSAVLFVGLTAACTDVELGQVEQATTPSGLSATVLALGHLGDAEISFKVGGVKAKIKDDITVHIHEIRFTPGGHMGWHTHSGPVIGTVISGTLTSYEAENPCVGTQYPAGTSFLDPGLGHVHLAINEGSDPLVLRVQVYTPVGGAPRVDAPAPPGAAACH